MTLTLTSNVGDEYAPHDLGDVVALSPAGAGQAYGTQLVAAGAVGAVEWTLVSGALPPGLILSAGGLIHGTARWSGIAPPFTVCASDGGTVDSAGRPCPALAWATFTIEAS